MLKYSVQQHTIPYDHITRITYNTLSARPRWPQAERKQQRRHEARGDLRMKPYPSVVHAYTYNRRPAIDVVEPKHLDEVSNRVPPTPHTGNPAAACRGGVRGAGLAAVDVLKHIV